MHSPQRMHRDRKSASSTEPGGRRSRSFRPLPSPVFARISGTAAAPAARPVRVPAPANIGRSNFGFLAEEAKLQAAVRATSHAVHAHQALGFAPRHSANGIVAALAMQQAPVALVAARCILVQSENRPARHRSQQRSQRANRAAPQTSDAQTGPEDQQEQDAQHQSLRKMRLTKIKNRCLQHRVQRSRPCFDRHDVAVFQRSQHRAHCEVECRQQRQADRPHQQAEWIEPSDRHRAEATPPPARDQHDIL